VKVLVAEPISSQGISRLRQEVEVDVKFDLSREGLLACIGQYDGIIVRSGTKLDRELLNQATNLKVIGRAGAGVDNIDLETATGRGILVVNAPESNTLSAAEHTIALLLAQLRNIPQSTSLLRQGQWTKTGLSGQEANEKCLGIIGLGRIGSVVARMAQGLGMRVMAYDPYISEEQFQRCGAEQVNSLDELCQLADVITVHTPLTKETSGMIGQREFNLMKKGVRVINCARGGIIDEQALYQALINGRVASAGLDVFDQEPCEKNILLTLDTVICTPHLGGSTEEALERVGRDIAEEILRGLRGDLVRYPLNMPSIDTSLQAFISPYLTLAEKMGSLYVQLFKPQIEKLEITYGGEISRYQTDLVTTALLKGLFAQILDQQVNMVNASALASQRGIQIVESKVADIADFLNSLILRATGHQIVGTVFGRNDGRIIGIDTFQLDLLPRGPILISWHIASHTNQPGVIGQIGTLLGQAQINIHRIEVGNSPGGDRALLALNLDDRPSEDILRTYRQMPGVLDARLILL
jgi:D-3-phosphoglycerate dehydrogenase